jgi:hypothetical protein
MRRTGGEQARHGRHGGGNDEATSLPTITAHLSTEPHRDGPPPGSNDPPATPVPPSTRRPVVGATGAESSPRDAWRAAVNLPLERTTASIPGYAPVPDIDAVVVVSEQDPQGSDVSPRQVGSP